MQALLKAAREKAQGREPDLKSAMQAACSTGDETVLRVLVEEGGFKVCGKLIRMATLKQLAGMAVLGVHVCVMPSVS